MNHNEFIKAKTEVLRELFNDFMKEHKSWNEREATIEFMLLQLAELEYGIGVAIRTQYYPPENL